MRISYLCCLILLSSCAKEIDYLKTHTDNPDRVCSISRFRYYEVFAGWDTITLTYNRWGNPIQGDRAGGAGTGNPNYVFRYDKNQRLTDYIGMYDHGNGAENWHRYTYDNQGRIVIDSQYNFVTVRDSQFVSALDVRVSVLTYDNQNRVFTETVYWDGGVNPIQYNYNKQGNIASVANWSSDAPLTGVYDDKISFRRTNPIWMFLDRDYSVNNLFVADMYNEFGLPTIIGNVSSINDEFGNFFYNYYSVLDLDYACPDVAGHTR